MWTLLKQPSTVQIKCHTVSVMSVSFATGNLLRNDKSNLKSQSIGNFFTTPVRGEGIKTEKVSVKMCQLMCEEW